MSRINGHALLGIIIMILMVTIGCSSNGNPVNPSDNPAQPIEERNPGSDRVLFGIWDLGFDPANMEITVAPSRHAEAHYNITSMIMPPQCSDCLSIVTNSFNPVTRIFDADVTLRNKYHVNGYDVRGIIYTNDYGHELTNADDWTPLWDIPGGMNINPFIAFAKNMGNRLFISDAEHTENFLIYIPDPPYWNYLSFAVDASWQEHCTEPYLIDNFSQMSELYDETGSSVFLHVDVHDWQDDILEVKISIPEISGEEYTDFTYAAGDTWELELTNSTGAPAGEYEAKIAAVSEGSGIYLYDWVTITIATSILDVPEDVTPPSLNFSPNDIDVVGNYAYVAGKHNGLHIFDVTNPNEPEWISRLESPSEVHSIVVDSDYAYVSILNQGLVIVDISDPWFPFVVTGVYGMFNTRDVAVEGGYAYIADGENGLRVIDVDPPESAYIAHTVNTISVWQIAASDGHIYATADEHSMAVIDIETPSSATVISSVKIPKGTMECIDVHGDLAAVTSNGDAWPWCDVFLIDVSDPELPVVTKEVNTVYVTGVNVTDDYVYADSYYGMYIIDVALPGTASIVNTIALDWDIGNLDVYGDYAYVVDLTDGLYVVDISSPGDAFHAASVLTPVDALAVSYSDGYAYVGSFYASTKVIDVGPLPDASIVSTIPMNWVNEIIPSDGHAYISNIATGMQIFDIDPPEAPTTVANLDIDGGRGLALSGDYAYLTTSQNGFSILDISDPEEVSIIKDLDIDGEKWAVVVEDGYAYMANGVDGMCVIDIDPPEDAEVVKTVPTPDNALDVAVSDGYAYIACADLGLVIIDIDPLEEAYVLKSIELPGYSRKVAMDGSHALVAGSQGIHFVVSAPVELAHLVYTYDKYPDIRDVFISGNLAYLAHYEGGLRVIQFK